MQKQIAPYINWLQFDAASKQQCIQFPQLTKLIACIIFLTIELSVNPLQEEWNRGLDSYFEKKIC